MGSAFSPSQVEQFHRDGFVIVRHMFDRAEMDKLLSFGQADPALVGSTYGRRDATGRETKLALWNAAGEDLYSMFARNPRIVDPME